MRPSYWCQKSTSSARGISVVQIQTSYQDRKLKMTMTDCVYEILCRDVLGNCSLCLWKRLKFKTWVAKMFLKKLYQIYGGKLLPSLMIGFTISRRQLWKCLRGHAFNNYSMLTLRFHTSSISIIQLIRTPNHIFYRRIAPK